MTARQQELVARVAALGPAFEERARRYDRDASFPHENWADLRAAGLLGLCIPERYGGLGADLLDYALVAEEIGRHCGSTALTFNMHCVTLMLTGFISDALGYSPHVAATHEVRRTDLYRGVLEHGHIHAQPFSEGVAAGATAGVLTRATPVDGGFVLKGRKLFASLAGAADFYNTTCQVPGEDHIRFLSVPAGAAGLRLDGTWDPLGMRGTVSIDLVFDDVFVPVEREVLPPGAFDEAAVRWPFYYMSLSFAYLGVARAALDFTQRYLRGEVAGMSASARRDHPVKQAGWAQMQLVHERARALCFSVLGDVCTDPPPELVRRAWASTFTTMEAAPEIASLALRVCGGRSLLKTFDLERYYRDARCGATMNPWSGEACLERLGRFGLYDTDEAPA